MTNALFPGSFDPVTNGHVDIIKKAAKIFTHLDVAVMTNTQKKYLFTAEERVRFLQDAVKDLSNVDVKVFQEQLTVDVAKQLHATAIVRGVRNSQDFLYEQQIAGINRQLAPNIETVLLFAETENSFVASSMVKEVAKFGANLDQFLPHEAAVALKEKMRNND